MKMIYPVIIAFLLCTANSFAQDYIPIISESEWQKIIAELQKENWADTEKLSAIYLKKIPKNKETADEAAVLRYMYLSSVAGQLGEKTISKEEAVKRTKSIVGKTFITPQITFRQKGMFNFFRFSEEENKWSKCFANTDNTFIYMFEYYDMANKDLIAGDFLKEADGKNFRLTGKIESIAAEGSAMPRLKVNFSEVDILDVIE